MVAGARELAFNRSVEPDAEAKPRFGSGRRAEMAPRNPLL